MQDMTKPVSLPSFYLMQDIPLLLASTQCFISHTNGPTDLLNPFPALHFKPFKIFVIYMPKCPGLNTILGYVRNAAPRLLISRRSEIKSVRARLKKLRLVR
jgi:hypothetical protein